MQTDRLFVATSKLLLIAKYAPCMFTGTWILRQMLKGIQLREGKQKHNNFRRWNKPKETMGSQAKCRLWITGMGAAKTIQPGLTWFTQSVGTLGTLKREQVFQNSRINFRPWGGPVHRFWGTGSQCSVWVSRNHRNLHFRKGILLKHVISLTPDTNLTAPHAFPASIHQRWPVTAFIGFVCVFCQASALHTTWHIL